MCDSKIDKTMVKESANSVESNHIFLVSTVIVTFINFVYSHIESMGFVSFSWNSIKFEEIFLILKAKLIGKKAKKNSSLLER